MRLNTEHQNLSAIENEASLDELGLSDEELDGIKGGPIPGGDDGGGGRSGGDWIINHNETIANDNSAEAELDDRALSDEELDGVKGGPRPGVEDGGGGIGGDWIINHNETFLTDSLN